MRKSSFRILIISCVVIALMSLSIMVYAAACKHPHLTRADQAIDRAFAQLTDAQKANEFDLGGHAQKAKDLLEQARMEVKDAIQWKATHHCK